MNITRSFGQNLKPKILDANNTINAIIQSGDTVYLGGSFTQVGFHTGNLAKLSTTSVIPDHEFPRVSGIVYDALPDGSGGWYLGGSFSYVVNGQSRNYLAHLLANGTFDASFNPQPNSTVQKLLLSGSTLYALGSFSQIGGQNRLRLAALSTTTGQANGFNPQPNSTVEDMQLVGSTLYVGGAFTEIGGRQQRYFAPLNTTTGQATQTLD
ncbi:MAG: delta-60 repeat domain-containing protein, partial [Adhaeribacter sp.]